MSEEIAAPNGETGEQYYCNKEEFMRYIQDMVNPARGNAGLQELDLKTAEECYRILNDFAREHQKEASKLLSGYHKASWGV